MFGGITEDGKYGFDPTKGVLLENLMQLKAPPYMSTEISVPVLFIQALKDLSLPPQLAEGMGEVIPQLTIEKIDTGHWALVEDPETINGIIAGWLAKIGAESV
ncbi:hypothetical protein CNMCM5623_007804 [Aspergillus felis]|uniref:AB hydrolase-1 domain-containing protein n=1 Tax=Aspergillus felis TaxID=1287682 RepID=A0A8H6PY72_9EURO|nr:hypothetical protein CNMCM5623_007804 [Aspergillus felis]